MYITYKNTDDKEHSFHEKRKKYLIKGTKADEKRIKCKSVFKGKSAV